MKGARPALSDAGFTLVEVLVALVILTVVAVSLGGAMETAIRNVRLSRMELNAAHFLESEVERLRTISYDSLSDGRRTRGPGVAEWTVADSTRFRLVLLETRYGSPAGGWAVDSVTIFRTP